MSWAVWAILVQGHFLLVLSVCILVSTAGWDLLVLYQVRRLSRPRVHFTVSLRTVRRLLKRGFRKPLTDADLWSLRPQDRSRPIVDAFYSCWREVGRKWYGPWPACSIINGADPVHPSFSDTYRYPILYISFCDAFIVVKTCCNLMAWRHKKQRHRTTGRSRNRKSCFLKASRMRCTNPLRMLTARCGVWTPKWSLH